MIGTNANPHHEYALKRANEFLQLGKHQEAAECLYDFIKNKKNRVIIGASETVMKTLLDVCVTHKMSQLAKDSLYCYRTMCQGVNIKSWEDIISSFLQHIEEQLDLIINTSTPKNELTFINESVTPENIIRYTINEGNRVNNDRLLVSPYIKFSWDCYRFCLDLLRNCQGDKFYHLIAQKACKFCVRYSRKNELRKLCNLLRLHFSQYQKRQEFSEINCTEARMLYLETGMVQLESTINLEDWQDAFKVVEDIHFVINMQKRFPHSRAMSIYYDKLSFLFWQANELLYHAAALMRCFLLTRDMKKNISGEDIFILTSKVVLAVLSTPLQYANPTVDLITENDDSFLEKKHRLLTTLLDLPYRPSRKSLVKDIVRYNILRDAPPEICNTFQILECTVDPLSLIAQLKRNFDIIQNWNTEIGLMKYFKPIYRVTTIILVSNLSSFYANISFKKFRSLAPPLENYILEPLLVDIARKYNISLRIDHNSECIHFDSQLNMINEGGNALNFQKKDYLDNANCYLVKVHSSLCKTVKVISPSEEFNAKLTVRDNLLKTYFTTNDNFRQEMKDRKKKIDKYKEMIENLKAKKEDDDKKRAIDIQLKYEAAEKERLQRETEERIIQRRIKEQDELKKQILMEKMEVLKKSEIGPLIEKYNLSNIDNLDAEKLFYKHIEFINKEKKEFIKRLKGQERAIDHLERAKRLEEIPLLIQKYENEDTFYRNEWEEYENNRIFKICEQRRHLVHTKSRLKLMKEDVQDFIQFVQNQKKAQFQEEMKSFSKLLCDEREKRLKEREDRRKAERRLIWLQQQHEKSEKGIKKKEVIQKRINVVPLVLTPTENRTSLKASKVKNETLSGSLEEKIDMSFGEGIFINQNQNFKPKILARNPKHTLTNSPKSTTECIKTTGLHKTSFTVVQQENNETLNEKGFGLENLTFPKFEKPGLQFTDNSDQKFFSISSQNLYNKNENIISKCQDRIYQRSFFNSTYLNKRERCCPKELDGKFRGPTSQSWRHTNVKSMTSKKEAFTDYAFQRKKSFFKIEHNQPNKNEEIGNYDGNHSCTPWAKLNRTSHSDKKFL